jgi:4,5-dihydroxyphthalate decarboxylase
LRIRCAQASRPKSPKESIVANTRVSLIGELYDCVKPLFDGTLQPEGVELVVTRSPSPEAMRRQLTAWEFDICEMAFGAYLIARRQGADVTAIPVFPRRAFFHTNFMCHANAGIDGPRDLAHKRIGVAEYVQSATLWARGVLEHDFGLDPRKAQWYVERAGSGSTGEVLGFKPPHDITVRQTPGGKSLVAMLAAGELDLALAGGNAQAQADNALRPLFADAIAEGKRFYVTHGYVPANHLYMIRGSLAREQLALVANLYRALCEAKTLAQQSLPRDRAPGLLFGTEQLARTCETFAGDPFAYGIGANRTMLETVVQLCHEQGLIRDLPPVEQLFVSGTD